MAARSARRRIRRSFTLVEMLVVIVIIGILAGLITGAALVVQRRAKIAAMRAELADIELALAAFKDKFGDYPPDGTDAAAMQNFVKRIAPRYTGALPAQATGSNPASSLVFWLGGMKDASGVYIGFSANPSNPFEIASSSRLGPYYEFRKERVKASGNVETYLPPNGNSNSDPYVYFRARANGQYTGSYTSSPSGTTCRPCLDLQYSATAFAEPKKYQLRAPGLDGKYGPGIQFPAGTDYDQYQYDDLANFCDGTLGDRIP